MAPAKEDKIQPPSRIEDFEPNILYVSDSEEDEDESDAEWQRAVITLPQEARADRLAYISDEMEALRLRVHELISDRVNEGETVDDAADVRDMVEEFADEDSELSELLSLAQEAVELEFGNVGEEEAEDEEVEESTEEEEKSSEYGEVLFDPPLYIQRYQFVMNTLKEEEKKVGLIKTFADLGASECSFLKYFRYKSGTETVYGVDIDRSTLERNSSYLKPLVADYLERREDPLMIELLCGSIADQDSRLYKVDAVSAIELIEHLHPPELAAFPKTVFGYMQPKLVVITTPNIEYNALFQEFQGPFRHWDHKFEWTRAEFESWARGIVVDYPEYRVDFTGVGDPSNGPVKEGPCSQIAIFRRTEGAEYRFSEAVEEVGKVYESVAEHVYPFFKDPRTVQQKLLDEVNFAARTLALDMRSSMEEYEGLSEVPVDISSTIVFSLVAKLSTDVELIAELLRNNGHRVEDGKVYVDLGPEYCDDDDDFTNHCDIFGTHQFDEEDGTPLDCPCYNEFGRLDDDGQTVVNHSESSLLDYTPEESWD